MTPGLYRVTAGPDAGAMVRYYFTNASGLADCRYAEDFGPFRKGEIVVVRPENMRPHSVNQHGDREG